MDHHRRALLGRLLPDGDDPRLIAERAYSHAWLELKGFDPMELRDPHTGKWVDVGPIHGGLPPGIPAHQAYEGTHVQLYIDRQLHNGRVGKPISAGRPVRRYVEIHLDHPTEKTGPAVAVPEHETLFPPGAILPSRDPRPQPEPAVQGDDFASRYEEWLRRSQGGRG